MFERTFCKIAVTDFASACEAKTPGFTRRERRKVVVQHVTNLIRRHEAIDKLLIAFRTKRYCRKRLCFATSEQG